MSMLKEEPRGFWMIVHLIAFLLAIIWAITFLDSMPIGEWKEHYSMLVPYIMAGGCTTCAVHGIMLLATK